MENKFDDVLFVEIAVFDYCMQIVIQFFKDYYGWVDSDNVWKQQLLDTQDKEYKWPITVQAAFKDNEIVAAVVANKINPLDEDENYRDSAYCLLAYCAKEEYLSGGLLSEILKELIERAENKIKNFISVQGDEYLRIVVESEKGKKKYYSLIGFKELKGVKYFEPFQDFDTETGVILNEEDTEHQLTLMVKTEKDSLTEEEVTELITGIIYWYWPDQDDGHGIKYSDKAYKRIEKYFEELLENILESFEDSGDFDLSNTSSASEDEKNQEKPPD